MRFGFIVAAFLSTAAQAQAVSAKPKTARQNAASSREIYIASHDDFCVFGPSQPGTAVSQSGKDVVSWCTPKGGHGGRTIPDGALQGVTYMQADNWLQVSGVGDFTRINIKPGDWGGQFDSGENKPDGAKVFAGPDKKEVSSWVTLISADVFCFRACLGDSAYCPTDFADKGCYDLLSKGVGPSGTFQSCTSDDGLPPAKQGDTAPEWRDCQTGPISVNTNSGTVATTSWVPVQTCMSCADTSAAASSTAQSSDGGESIAMTPVTSQQGITRVSETALAAEADSLDGSSSMPNFISAPTTAAATATSANGSLIPRQAEATTTSNGQCCFTTYTPTVNGAGGPTGASGGSSTTSSVSGSATTPSSSSAILSGGMPVTSSGNQTGTTLLTNSTATSTRASSSTGSATSAANTTRPGGNGTNANGSDSAASKTFAGLVWDGHRNPWVGLAGLVIGVYVLL